MNRDLKILCPAYLKLIRSKPCCVCMVCPVDADHIQARGTGSAKRNDLTAIPLCREHHSERGQIGNNRFEAKYRINLWREVSMLLIEAMMTIPPLLPLTKEWMESLEEVVEWRTCPGCKESHPWKVNVPEEFKECYRCREIEARKSAVALARAGEGSGFGGHGGGRR